MHSITARHRQFAVAAAITGGALLALVLVARATGTSGTDPPAQSARQETIRQEEQRTRMSDDQTAKQQEKQPETKETVHDTGDGATTQVTVNGEEVTVPANGSYQRTTDDGSTRTDVRVNNRNESTETGNSSSNHSSSKIRVNVRSDSGP